MRSIEASARIGLLNIMPSAALDKTHQQWQNALTQEVEVIPVRFSDDPRISGCTSSSQIECFQVIDDVADTLDGLVVTGANLERRPDGSEMPFDEIRFAPQLAEVIDWAESETRLTIYSCLASHFALNQLFGMRRDIEPAKVFGVFCHDVIEDSPYTRGLEIPVRAPHSRWGGISSKLLRDAGVEVLIEGFEPDWLLAQYERPTGTSLFLQGHPEYERDDLKSEYERDALLGQFLPHKYFPRNDPTQTPDYLWGQDSATIFANISLSLTEAKVLA